MRLKRDDHPFLDRVQTVELMALVYETHLRRGERPRTIVRSTMATTFVSAPSTTSRCERELVALVRRAAATGDEIQILEMLKRGLVAMSRAGSFKDFEFPAPLAHRYSRRLVYSDPWGRFTIIGMTWNVGQGTALHDHSGVWCVEVVVDGEMQVENYQLLHDDVSGLCRFEKRETLPAPPASSGALIPPFEHHVFSNVGSQPSHSLHVYGGSMSRCNVFERVGDGLYQRRNRELRVDE